MEPRVQLPSVPEPAHQPRRLPESITYSYSNQRRRSRQCTGEIRFDDDVAGNHATWNSLRLARGWSQKSTDDVPSKTVRHRTTVLFLTLSPGTAVRPACQRQPA